ncbi:response regulator transcription factor [Streptomyces sp. NPDC048275]|uniref:response regulator transcription factor n=1 Tax=Streptomyces sp. NPDC048275 TaxID=3155629 RepID=UPI0033F4E6B1
MTPTRIVVADGHTLFRDALSDLLNRQDGIMVVGQAATGVEAVQAAASLRPDLLLLDLWMPDHPGPGTVRSILRASPPTCVLILSAHAEPHQIRELQTAGASAYLHKGITRDELLRALTGPAADDEDGDPEPRPLDAWPKTAFSPREHQILECVASAMSNRQIAAALGITEGTVKRHLHNVYRKLGAVSRVDAVNKAITASVLPSPVPVADVPLDAEGPYGQGAARDRTAPL